MKSVLICFFSGTGNTKKVVEQFSKTFQGQGFEVVLHNIDDGPFDGEISKFDLFGIAYPVHAFNAPANVLEFAKTIKKLPKKQKKAYFVVNTSGEPLKLNNISSLKLNSMLRKRGFKLTNEYHYCMPYNIIFRHTDNMAHKMWETAQKVIPLDCKQIVDGEKSRLGYVPCGRFLAWIFRVEHWGGKFNGRRYKVSDKCLKCGLCIKKVQIWKRLLDVHALLVQLSSKCHQDRPF